MNGLLTPSAFVLSTILFMVFFVGAIEAQQSQVTHHWVYQTNANIGYTHMSMIETFPDGEIAVAFQAAKSTEGADDQAIFWTTSTDGGVTWSNHTVAVNDEYAVWGPVLHYDTKKSLMYLFHSVSGPFNRRTSDRCYPGGNIRYVTSADKGKSWSEPVVILPFYSESRGNISKMTANKLVVNDAGWWVLPFWQEAHTVNDTGPAVAGVLISKDGGSTWAPEAFIHNDKSWLIENTVALTNAGYMVQLFRTQLGFIYMSQSLDGGVTWSTAVATELLNPDSKVMVTRRTDTGNLVLAYNPSATQRNPLDLVESDTSAKSWNRDFAVLADTILGNYAYPTPMQIGKQVYTTYSASTKDGIMLAIADLP